MVSIHVTIITAADIVPAFGDFERQLVTVKMGLLNQWLRESDKAKSITAQFKGSLSGSEVVEIFILGDPSSYIDLGSRSHLVS